MRRTLSAFLVVCVVTLASFAAWRNLAHSPTHRQPTASAGTTPATASNARLLAAYNKLPLGFEPNQGQTDARVQFLARGNGYTVFLAGNEADIRLEPPPAAPNSTAPHNAAERADQPAASAVVRIALAQSNPHAQADGSGVLAGHSNYLIGNDGTKWQRHVPQFGRVQYRDMYPGVDLVYYGNQGQLESDYVVAPRADPQQIALHVTGQRSLKLNSQGDVVLNTAAGDVFLRRPRAYQRSGNTTQEVAASYEAPKGTQFIRIKLGPYDSTQPLIIDPVLAYSTYLGGSLNNFPRGIAVDSAGFAYVTGFTSSADFPTTAGTLQTTPKNAKGTVFVSKLSKDGTALVYSTFLGGTGANGESSSAIALDSLGDAYIIGGTSSTDFPLGTAPYQSVNKGGGGFFTKLDPAGANILYSTYLNGSGVDRLQGLAVDANGNAYITGATTSTDFPIIPGTALQTSNNVSGSQIGTAFLSRINPSGTGTGSLVYSTYLGGSKEDSGLGVAVDASANAYVTGYTSSADFPQPASKNGFQTTLRNPSGNAFVARIDTSQPQALIYSTYLGGTPNGFGSNPGDIGNAIALGPSGNAYMFGYSYAPDYPLLNAFDTQSNTFEAKAVISRVDTTQSGARSLVYSTFLGGTTSNVNLPGVHGAELAFSGAVDAAGNIYVAGTSSSIDFPTTPGAPQTSRVGQQNAFLAELNPTGSALVFSTYLGGSGEAAYSMALDGANPPNAYITGLTAGNFPTTTGAFQTSDNVTGTNNEDGFVAKLSPGAVTGVFASPTRLAFGTQTVQVASAAKTVTLFNDSASTITITGPSFSGTNAADFSQTTTCGASLAAAATCTYSVIFTPSTSAAESATFSIADSDSTSPQTVALSGTGAAAPSAIVVTPTTLTFGTSPQAVTLTNNGTSALTITGITITGTNAADFGQTNTCGASLAAGANCTISVTFTGSTTTAESATLSVADSDVSSPQTVSLANSAGSPDFSLGLAPTSLTLVAGKTGTITATLSPINGFAGTVSLACTGAPALANCVFSPGSVTVTATGMQTSTGSVTTTLGSLAPPPPSIRRIPGFPAALWTWLALAIVLLAFWLTRRRGSRKLAWALAAVALFVGNGCSGVPGIHVPGTPQGTYTLTITATSGSLTHSSTVSLTVN